MNLIFISAETLAKIVLAFTIFYITYIFYKRSSEERETNLPQKVRNLRIPTADRFISCQIETNIWEIIYF